jgi:[NiFe] hydrogenase diaphorase moiety small subunit
MAELFIDGCSVAFTPGQSIMQAAESAGIYIPHLCYHPEFRPHGSCRICLVRVDGRLLSACTLPAADGMVVENLSDEVMACRRQLLEMLFTEGNHLCPACEKSGACTLQAVAVFCGMLSPDIEFRYPARALDASHPDMLFDDNRCIRCELCVRASRDIDGKNVFHMAGRGENNGLRINSPSGRLVDSGLEASDRAASICPVGALIPKHVGFKTPIGQRKFDVKPLSAMRKVHDAD